MKKDDIENIEKDLKAYIEQNSGFFPFVYQYCEIDVRKDSSEKENDVVKFGHYKTEEKNSYPFYKPFSKIINFADLDE